MSLTVTSSAFKADSEIPTKYTCEGDDVSPPLAWSGAPDSTRTYVIIVDDPDAPDPQAPKMTYVHWVLFDIPPNVTSLAEGGSKTPPPGSREGNNDWKRTGWGGPCPPIGRHRYYFKVYALNAELGNIGSPATKADVERLMEGKIIAQGQLMGTYQKKR
jgi:Raf kinase inhibitor-like YbhB/YbcL family protein